ncbi:phosphonates import ATP-binding protein PhnC 1 [Shewanella hanedai]|uniref:ATP-binding cassette domain-containing protein n=1 Tax=Shewanella hanedai TaxID=25 RepID=A0A553JGQ3_SHEHA|nr:ATP-binding cassette domain-containing protein [Shewanella hanedai]TRY11628.1 ATP-binding cassette domain-containing protein [Shewanella hanedai]GGJ01890.1 phosphonates import ATP-binding protein PhnC 1 [Shewanella hanedai]
MVNFEDLTLKYTDKLAISQLSLSIKHGEKVAIIGPSGAGKSTLLFHLYSLLKDNAAFCSQKQGLVDGLSTYHNVYMGSLARHNWLYNVVNLVTPFSVPLGEVNGLCHELSLDVPMAKLLAELSGGQRQRVALARALYQRQPIFIGDEPFSALDPLMAEHLLKLVLARHSSAIMVLHDKSQALSHFDRIIGLREGKLCLDVTQDELTPELLAHFYSHESFPQPCNA